MFGAPRKFPRGPAELIAEDSSILRKEEHEVEAYENDAGGATKTLRLTRTRPRTLAVRSLLAVRGRLPSLRVLMFSARLFFWDRALIGIQIVFTKRWKRLWLICGASCK